MIRDVLSRLLACLLALTSVVCPAAAAEAAEEWKGICITEVSGGTLSLDGRVLRAGDVLTLEQAERMTADVREGMLKASYLPVFADHVAAEETFSLRGKENQAPVAEDQALETYKNLPNTGKLKVHDPEEGALSYTLVRQPRRGSVELAEDGSFTYTPKKNKVGVDSFTYTATDPEGMVSREATVTVTILKPADARQYQDTLGQSCRFAAEWMRHTGIFAGEQLAQEPCFGPDKAVTQGEFLTMLVKTLELPVEQTLTESGYEQVPGWLKPYLAAAVRAGLTQKLPAFAQDQVITGSEAAAVLEAALDQPAFSHLTQEPLTRGQAAQVLYETAKLREADKRDTIL